MEIFTSGVSRLKNLWKKSFLIKIIAGKIIFDHFWSKTWVGTHEKMKIQNMDFLRINYLKVFMVNHIYPEYSSYRILIGSEIEMK